MSWIFGQNNFLPDINYLDKLKLIIKYYDPEVFSIET